MISEGINQNQIIMSRNANSYCAVKGLDLEKAFGSVLHDLLMTELFTLGFDGIVLHWFKSHLSNRTQFVFWRKTKSKGFHWKNVFLLGPKLFCIYIYDTFLLPLSGKLVLYADNSTLICKHKSLEGLEETIITDLYVIQEWLQKEEIRRTYFICGQTWKAISIWIFSQFWSSRMDKHNFISDYFLTDYVFDTKIIENNFTQLLAFFFYFAFGNISQNKVYKEFDSKNNNLLLAFILYCNPIGIFWSLVQILHKEYSEWCDRFMGWTLFKKEISNNGIS